VISIVLSALIIFVQKNYKRLLAYSSIEHAGIIAVGFGFGGIGVFAALLHMLYHALAKSLLFLSAGNIFVRYGSTKMRNISGMLTALPVTSLLFFAGFLAATGIPPFGTFATEVTIISSGFAEHPFAAGIVLFGIVTTFVGFFKHIYALLWGEVPQGIMIGETGGFTFIIPLVLTVVILVVSVYVPSGLQQLIQSAAYQLTHAS
jgi:hydrogenase-4 component F